MMNSGAPITGIDRRPLNKAGMDIRNNPFRYLQHDPEKWEPVFREDHAQTKR
jgi:hypothetical protein